MRVPISYALTLPGPRRDADPGARSDRRPARVLSSRTPRRSGCLRSRARQARAGGTYPCALQRGQRGRRRCVPGRPDRLPRHSRRWSRMCSSASTAPRRVISTSCERPTDVRASWWSPYGPDRRDRRAGGARDDPRGGSLLRRAGRRNDAAQVLHRLRSADREDDARQGRVRDRLDPARRLREDPRA